MNSSLSVVYKSRTLTSHRSRLLPEVATRVGRGSQPRYLWMFAALSVLIIPFENEFSVWGVSPAKMAIGFLLVAVISTRLRQWFSIWKHRVFVWASLFVVWCAGCESLHPYPDLEHVYRVLQMFVFSSLIATIALDRGALRRILFAVALICVFLALYLVANYYGSVSLGVSGYREAGRLRSAALGGMAIDTGLNILGYTIGMGAVVALSYFLGSDSRRARLFWGAIYVICAVGSFVPLSRGAFLAFGVGSIIVLWRNFSKLLRPGKIVLLVGMAVALISLMPQALTERYTSLLPDAAATQQKKPDGRLTLVLTALRPVSEYWDFGVGAGQYWNQWAVENGLGRWLPSGKPAVLGPHNAFLAAWIYFGLPGLVLLSLICASAARTCFKLPTPSPESTALLGMVGLVIVWLLFTHSLYLKPFGVVIGLIVGASELRKQQRTRQESRLKRCSASPQMPSLARVQR